MMIQIPKDAPDWFADVVAKIETVVRAAQASAKLVPSFTVANLPSATEWHSGNEKFGYTRLIYVTDETGGAVPAFSDGTNWRRVTDRAIVS